MEYRFTVFERTGKSWVCLFFFLGMLLYEIYEKHSKEKKLFIISVFISFVVLFCIVKNHMIDDQWSIFTFLLFPPVLFLFIGMEKFFSSKVFSVLGAVSFEIYLWHSPFLLFYKPARKMLKITYPVTHIEMLCFTVVLILFCLPIALVLEKRVRGLLCNYGLIRK